MFPNLRPLLAILNARPDTPDVITLRRIVAERIARWEGQS